MVIKKREMENYVNVDMEVMEDDEMRMREKRKLGFKEMNRGKGVKEIIDLIVENGGMEKS